MSGCAKAHTRSIQIECNSKGIIESRHCGGRQLPTPAQQSLLVEHPHLLPQISVKPLASAMGRKGDPLVERLPFVGRASVNTPKRGSQHSGPTRKAPGFSRGVVYEACMEERGKRR